MRRSTMSWSTVSPAMPPSFLLTHLNPRQDLEFLNEEAVRSLSLNFVETQKMLKLVGYKVQSPLAYMTL